MISKLKAIVFDKDGVLADSEAINLSSAFTIFRAHGCELAPEDEALIVGRHPLDYVPVLARRFDLGSDRQQQMIREQDEIYSRTWLDEGRLLDGAREGLETARASGLQVGLATSSSRREVEEFLARFELASFFDLTLSLDDVTRSKPDPEMYLSMAERLGIHPSEMLVLEDSEHGVRAAKDAGAICAAVRSRHIPAERVAIADMQIDSAAELRKLLEEA